MENNMEKLIKTRNELAKAIQELEVKEKRTADEELQLIALNGQLALINQYIDMLKRQPKSENNENSEFKKVDNEVLKIKNLSAEEEKLFQECYDMFEELEKMGYYEDKLDEHKETDDFLYRVDCQEDFEGRLDKLKILHYDLTKKLKEFKKEKATKTGTIAKKIGAVVLATAILVGAFFIAKDIKSKEKAVDVDPDNTIELEYNTESYDYFIGKGVRPSDAEKLASNSTMIMSILNENNAGIKVNDVDEMLFDIYDGKNITSTMQDYDSYDTYADIGNEASTDVFNNMAGVPGYESIDSNRCANILDTYRYLDITDGSDYDKFNETLADAISKFYLDSSKENAQNLIDTMYTVNKEDGFLTPSLEGLLAEFMAGPGAAVLVNYGELTVSKDLTKHNITANELINDIVMQIEVFERDCTYTRSLN